MNFATFKTWLFHGLAGTAVAALTFLAQHVGAVNPSSFLDNPAFAGIAGILFSLLSKLLGGLIAKIPGGDTPAAAKSGPPTKQGGSTQEM